MHSPRTTGDLHLLCLFELRSAEATALTCLDSATYRSGALWLYLRLATFIQCLAQNRQLARSGEFEQMLQSDIRLALKILHAGDKGDTRSDDSQAFRPRFEAITMPSDNVRDVARREKCEWISRAYNTAVLQLGHQFQAAAALGSSS